MKKDEKKMKILYATDLHGDKWKYEQMYKASKGKKVDVAINGGDMFPSDWDPFRQDKFISGFLENYFKEFEKSKIYYLSMPGNDDLKVFDKLFENTLKQLKYVYSIARKKKKIGDYEFIGMNLVADYPFLLKDRCRRDTDKYRLKEDRMKGVVSTKKGFKYINWMKRASELPTLDEELKKLPVPKDTRKAIYIIHMPPVRLGLDHCLTGDRVGSKAVYNFIKEKQPRFSLHGHIHESPYVSEKWTAKLGKTVCIQPGQGGNFDYAIINLKTGKYRKYSISR